MKKREKWKKEKNIWREGREERIFCRKRRRQRRTVNESGRKESYMEIGRKGGREDHAVPGCCRKGVVWPCTCWVGEERKGGGSAWRDRRNRGGVRKPEVTQWGRKCSSGGEGRRDGEQRENKGKGEVRM